MSISLSGRFEIGGKVLFDAVELSLAEGEWTCLLGPSGSGKSTILRLIAGLETGGAFHGRLDGAAGQAAYMAQSDLLAPWLDVTGNVTLGARLRGEAPDLDRARNLISRVGLAGHEGKRPAELSGGMRQRAALARTLMEDRPVALLDEPFSALDAATRAQCQELAFELLEGRTVLLVTHDPAEAARLGHQVHVLGHSGLTHSMRPAGRPIRDPAEAETLAAQVALFKQVRAA
ncbi:ATP-binding cassette domain-containing protein [Rhodobacteraceae bacterium NNCM2]|nr:ATP-binding cassette domain-containing protein [Coraliihabitans acroporae]